MRRRVVNNAEGLGCIVAGLAFGGFLLALCLALSR